MAEPPQAVFLSYASQDAEAAKRICTALRAAGVEVWFDQSELRGGDAWDQRIRKQIKTCALFLPLISASTQERLEGYFRLEWKLAVDRSHLMAAEKSFLLPVVVDSTADANALVPDRFRDVQWTRLPGGETPPAFVDQVRRLLSPDVMTPSPVATGLATPAGSSKPGKTARRSRSAMVMAAVAIIVAGSYIAVTRFVPRKSSAETNTASLPRAQPPAATSTIPEKSIAVLPFLDMSERHDQEYFSDGLTEEILNLLSQVSDLRVPARTSSFYFKGKSEDVSTIAQRLRVAHLLEGSVRKSGKTIRITTQLVRADDGYHLWSKEYDRDIKDIFKVQGEIAAAVVEALKLKLLPGQQLANPYRSDNPEAYSKYLLGRAFYRRGGQPNFRRAIEPLRDAIALDPGYAAAYALLSVNETNIAVLEMSHDSGLERAGEAAEKALAIAPQFADGYRARAWARESQMDFIGARSDMEKALALAPGDSIVQNDYAFVLAIFGQLSDAIETMNTAVELDPLNSEAWAFLGLYLTVRGDFASARNALERSEATKSGGGWADGILWQLDLLQGRFEDALAEYGQSNQAIAVSSMARAVVEHTRGHQEQSNQALEEMIAEHAKDSPYLIAEVYAWRGEKDKAFEWLERAYVQRDTGLMQIKFDPLLKSLLDDPRYEALLRKLTLSD